MSDISSAQLGLVMGDLSKNQDAANRVQQAISQTTTWYTLILVPVQNGPFAAQYDLQVSNLEIPQQVNLAAPAME